MKQVASPDNVRGGLESALRHAIKNEGRDGCLLEVGYDTCLCWRCRFTAVIDYVVDEYTLLHSQECGGVSHSHYPQDGEKAAP